MPMLPTRPAEFHVFDTSLRDGAQQEGIHLSVADKLKIAGYLDELGVTFIEGGWPGANPNDTEFFVRAKELNLKRSKLVAFGATRKAGVQASEDALTRALDPTRPVIGNDGWQHAAGDILGIHDYAPEPEALIERYGSRQAIERTFHEVRPHHHPLLGGDLALSRQPVVISEYGGLSFTPGDDDDWFGYGQFATVEEFLGRYEALTDALLRSTALAGFCYTQLTDTEQESNGLLTAERKPKFDMARIRSINGRPSRAVASEILDALIKQEVEMRRRKRGQEP